MMGICEKCGKNAEVILCVYRGEANNLIYMCHACVKKEVSDG